MLGGGRTDRTKDTEFSFYNSAACEKNLQNRKYLCSQIPILEAKTMV